ncbi:hypothetical protein AURDEDRAFT_171705 [Auricularia subglabra TFB-10046 SS5]|nr:hypothetical protein AURDEDRAFT_171705 [Auricularia subglabra TFB-10046 SS5]
MPDSDAVSEASTVTVRLKRNPRLPWGEMEEGMVGCADHSVQHAVVTALTSVIPAPAQGSVLQRDLAGLPENRGKYRPFIVLEKPRGRQRPGRIVLTTHFGKRPIAQVDAFSQTLAVPLGSRTPAWPAADSPRVSPEPVWEEENSYVIAYAIKLLPDRPATRYHVGEQEFQLTGEELKNLKALCMDRAVALATLSPQQLNAYKTAYEGWHAEYRSSKASSWQGSTYSVRSRASAAPRLPRINEARRTETPAATPSAPEVDEDGFTKVLTMVAPSTLLVSVALALTSLVFPTSGLVILNLGVDSVFEDYNVTGITDVGNPIVGAPLDSAFPPSQSWGLKPVGNGFYSIARFRADGEEKFAIAAHVDGLQGKELSAQEIGDGTAFLLEQPFGNGTEVFSFTFGYESPKLAITAAPSSNKPLTLELYDPQNKYQHWVWTGKPPSRTTGPIDVKSLPTASLADALAASPKFN